MKIPRIDNLDKGLDKWTIEVPLSSKETQIKCSGACTMKKEDDFSKVSVSFDGSSHDILKINNKTGKIQLQTFPGGIQRCYARILDKKLFVSNVVTEIIFKNEKIQIDGEVLFRQIANTPTPLDDLFPEITFLEPSSIFEIKKNKIVYEKSSIQPQKANLKLVYGQLMEEFERICKPGQPLAVLLSAGIDSRLNLAICQYFSKKYKNQVIAYHEYKDKAEHDIAKHAADIAKVPFVSLTRDLFKREPLAVATFPEFIEFHAGIYRESLIRWVPYFNLMRNLNPDCTIIGMGSEAHKGKFYRDIKDLKHDTREILGDKLKVTQESEKDFLPYSTEKMMDKFFSVMTGRALIFDDLYSQADFVHHHAYAIKHSAARSPYMNMHYNMSFPFLKDNFLSLVFSLPRKEKADAKIPIGLMAKLNQKLARVPFISGNQKGFRRHIITDLHYKIKYLLPQKVDTSRRGEEVSWKSQFVREKIDGSSSEITNKLEKFINANLSLPGSIPKGTIKIGSAIRMYLFLRQVEKSRGVEFICR